MLLKKLELQLLVLKLKLEILLLRKKRTIPNLPQPKIVVVHHGGGGWAFEQVNNHHKNLWGFISSLGFGIGYHKWIKYGGEVVTARRDNEEGAHTVDPANRGWWNKNSVGICLRGNTDIKKPTEWQLRALKEELDSYVARGFKIKYHGQIVSTACPGKYLKEWLKDSGYVN